MARVIFQNGHQAPRDPKLADLTTPELVAAATAVAMLIRKGMAQSNPDAESGLLVELAYRLEVPAIDVDHLERQRTWSRQAFGPGRRTGGVLDHISKELEEIREHPTDLSEWVDVIILALDGAWRAGYEPASIIGAIKDKQARNEARVWPDWRTLSEDMAIEHDRSAD